MLFVQSEGVPLVIDGLDPGEERLVEADVHLILGHLGRDVLGNLLHLVIRVGFQQIVEDAGDAVQGLAGILQRFDRILEAGRRRVGDDRIDFGLSFGDALLESRHIVLVADFIERRGSVGERGFGQKGIFHSA